MNSETTALLHLTSFAEDVSLSEILAFIYQELLYESRRMSTTEIDIE